MRRFAVGLVRGLGYLMVVAIALVLLVAGAAWAWLPNLEQYRPQVEHFLSDYLGHEIRMTSLSAEWNDANLSIRASGVRVAVEDHPGSGMRFGEIFLSFDPFSLLHENRTFNHLELKGATIEVSRLPDGRFRVGDTIIGQPRGVLRRLLQGRSLDIMDGTVVWRDSLAPGDGMEVDNVRISIRSRGGQRYFEFAASPPPALMKTFRARGSYDPRSLKLGDWTTDLNLSVTHLNLTRIPAVIQERLPWQSHGYIDTNFHASWKEGTLMEADAGIKAHDFIIPYARDKKPLSARLFTSNVSWQRSEEDWRLVFTDPEIVLDEKPVSVTRFEVQRQDAQRTYTGQDVNVQDLLGVVNRLDIELPWKDLIDRLRPRGTFSEAALTLTGPYLEARDWRFEGDFRNVGWSAQERYPGIQGLNGRMTADDKGGKLNIETSALEVDAEGIMPEPVAFRRVQGDVEWYRWGGDWVVDVGDVVASNDDMTLKDINFYTRVPKTNSESTFVLARCRIERADIKALRDYLPVKRMNPKQVEWLNRALAGGEITRGRFYLNGPLSAFPYDHGEGELQISARISDGVLAFDEKWPELTELQGSVELDNAHFEAQLEHGRFMDSEVRNARITSKDFFKRDRLLEIQADLRARANDVVQFLRRGPLNKNPPPEYSRMAAQGEGDLTLNIELPFTRLKEDARVSGAYTFDKAAVEVTDGVKITALSGTVDFTDSTVQGEGLEGRLFGGPVRADLATVKAGHPITFALTGSGEADVSRLEPLIGRGLISRLEGRTRWEGRFTAGPGSDRLEVQSDLEGVEIALPHPLWKPAETASRLTVDLDLEPGKQKVDLDLENGVRGTLQYARLDGKPTLVRGVLNLGADRALPDSELEIAVKGEHIDIDQWLSEIDKQQKLTERERGENADRDNLFDHLRFLEVDAQRFRYLSRDLGAVDMTATTRGDKRWSLRLDGPNVRGVGDLRLDQNPARYSFDLSRLYWPVSSAVERATTYKTLPKPSEFAYITINAADFRHGNKRLGKLTFSGAPAKHEWRIRKLSFEQPEFKLEATGSWSMDQFGTHRSQLQVTANAKDFGSTLTHLDMPGQVAGGDAELTAQLSWPGEPGDFTLARLNGDVSFSARQGRFLKLEPGSGRLLGLFNADTLTRRFQLDFSDVFKEGLAFDRINGDAQITAGRLHTDGIFIFGPAALLELEGDTSLGDETYDLQVTVAPQLGGNLSLAGAIANPAAGAMIFVVQKLFKKQVAKLINYKYRVTGGWDDPQVERIEHHAPDTASQVGRN